MNLHVLARGFLPVRYFLVFPVVFVLVPVVLSISCQMQMGLLWIFTMDYYGFTIYYAQNLKGSIMDGSGYQFATCL